MKIGDWCQYSGSKTLYLVFKVMGDRVGLVDKDGYAVNTLVSNCTPLHECTGWEWRPPTVVDPGVGYRLIDKSVDKWQEGDEFMEDGEWTLSNNGERHGYSKNLIYRRKLAPTYRPYTGQTECVADLHGVLVRHRDNAALRIANAFLEDAVWIAGWLNTVRFEELNKDWTKRDGTPCGILVK